MLVGCERTANRERSGVDKPALFMARPICYAVQSAPRTRLDATIEIGETRVDGTGKVTHTKLEKLCTPTREIKTTVLAVVAVLPNSARQFRMRYTQSFGAGSSHGEAGTRIRRAAVV